MVGLLPAKYYKWFIFSPLQVCLGKMPHSEGKAEKFCKGKRKCISRSLSAADGKVPLNWNMDCHLMFLPLFLASNVFCSFFNFLKLLNLSVKFLFWTKCEEKALESEIKVHMCWISYRSFALLSVKSRKQKGVLWSLRAPLPSWLAVPKSAPGGPCSPISSSGRRIIRDLRPFFSL